MMQTISRLSVIWKSRTRKEDFIQQKLQASTQSQWASIPRITRAGRAPDGATIAVPNDGSNESRAIKLLADNGLITLAETEDLYNLTSIAENPHNFEITELDAANLPRSLDDVDAAVINGNYALEANLNPEKDALAAELADSDESYKYINYLVVKEGNEESTKTKALIAALQNDDVKKYIEEKYSGSVIPAFQYIVS